MTQGGRPDGRRGGAERAEAITIGALVAWLESWADPAWQEGWDNCGWQVEPGCLEEPAKVLVCLTPTRPVLEEAARVGANLILAHHPLIFGGLKRLVRGDPVGALILDAAAQGIGIYSAHTNLDQARGGTASCLAKALGIEVETPMEVTGEGRGYGRVGDLDPVVPLRQVLKNIHRALRPATLVHSPADLTMPIRRLACLGGSGAGYLDQAIAAGACAYVTADVKFHQFQEARDRGIVLIDPGHYATERPAMASLVEDLRTFGVEEVALSEGDEEFRQVFVRASP